MLNAELEGFFLAIALLLQPLAKADDITRNWDFVVAVKYMREGFAYEHVCLGALVNEKQVVTAGHCFADRTLYLEKARLFPDRFGVIPLNLNIDVDLFKYPKDFQLFTVDHINIHPDFEYTAQVPFEIKNDVAIVTLKNSIPRPSAYLDLKIKPWSSPDKCWTVVWEVNDVDADDTKYFLREFALDEVENQACQARYANMAKFDQRFVCASNLFNNQFAVETGAPMICQHSNTGAGAKGHYIAGVISFVVSDRIDLPMGFTGLSHYTPWLKKHFNEDFARRSSSIKLQSLCICDLMLVATALIYHFLIAPK